ncbi:MAG TPA: 3-dehydroquinate synthase II [Methanocorpusculum sp.]|nr:3-dehydroquinate synthase II [Methanocorpusculum sp.]
MSEPAEFPSVFVSADSGDYSVRKKTAEAALENGFSGIILAESDTELARLGRFTTLFREGDALLQNGKRAGAWYHIDSAAALDAVSDDGGIAVIETENWHVLPFENLIARLKKTKIYALVKTSADAELSREIMEIGCFGLVISAPAESLKEFVASGETESVQFQNARITRISPLPLSDRVCIDTASILSPDEGMLVGSSSACLFFICSENAVSEYTAPRPFRVNAGAVHSYIRLPNDTTGYLSELSAGTLLPVADKNGLLRTVAAGRIKIEKRPMLLVEADVLDDAGNVIHSGSVIVQNAETIRFMTASGPKSVADLAAGDFVFVTIDSGGRHFGTKVDETIREL